jgi:WD40 repeat protein
MKKHMFLLASHFLLLAACAAPAATAAPSEVPVQSTPEQSPSSSPIITGENAVHLTPVAELKPSNGALTCSWAQEGKALWLQDIFSVNLVDAATLDQIAMFEGGEYSAIYDASSDGRLVAYSFDGVEIKILDIISQKDILTITPGFPYSIAFFSPGDKLLAVTSLENIEIVLFNLKDGTRASQLSGFTTAAPVYSASFGPDGDTLIWESRGTIQPMTIGSGELGPELSHEDFVVAVAGSPDGGSIATASAGTMNGNFQPLVTLWDSASGDVIWQQGNAEYFSSLDFSPDGLLLSAGTVGEVVIYDAVSGDEIIRLPFKNGAVNSLAFSPIGDTLLTCEVNGNVALWKLE